MSDTPPDYSPGETTPTAPVHAPPMRSPTTVHSSPIAGADSAPATPDWLLSNDAPSPPPCPSTDACPVCLCEFPSHSRGPETPFHWPQCGHALHLGCVAHLVANVRDLRCSTCRARWPPEAANTFTTACHAHGVEAPQPAPDHDTTSRQYHNSTAPRPPSHILPFCCPRLFLADSAHATSDAAWQDLPDGHMHWAPIHSRQSGRWRPEWVCLRCNAAVDEDHPLLQHVPEPPTCPAHGPRRLALDLREFSRGWVCCRGSPPEVLPCPGERVPLPDPPQPPLVGGAPEQPCCRKHQQLVIRAAVTCSCWPSPPQRTGSLGGSCSLCVAVARRPRHLRQAPPVARAALVHALHTLQQLAAQEGRAPPVREAQLLLTLAAEANLLPDKTSVHLLWAWQIVTLPDGYIPATVQEALLHVFIGEMAASALLQEVAALHRARAGPPTRAPASTSSGVRASTALQQPPVPIGSPSSSSSSSSSTSSTQNDPGCVEHDLPNCEHEPASDTRLRYRASLANLDPFLAEDVLARPCCLFRVPPHFCKGVLRRALHVALDLIRSSARTTVVVLAPHAPASARAWSSC